MREAEVVARFLMGEAMQLLADDYEVSVNRIEEVIRDRVRGNITITEIMDRLKRGDPLHGEVE